MKIGQLSSMTGTPVETIRFYERERLLTTASRSDGNYRIYEQPHAERLSFIRHCRSLDMTLDEIRVLLRFKDAPQGDCRDVDELLDEHIEHVAERIRELKALEKQLKQLRQQCGGEDTAACGILEGLTRGSKTKVSHKRRAHTHTHGTHGRRSAS